MPVAIDLPDRTADRIAARWRRRSGGGSSGAAMAWIVAVLVVLVGATAIVRWDIAARREAFAVDARAAHRELSQRMAQLDAVLATLVLLAPGADASDAVARLPAVWPAVLSVQRSDAERPWTDAALTAAAAQSRHGSGAQRRAVVAAVDAGRAQYWLVLAGNPVSWALRVDARRLVPSPEWPFSDREPVRAWLVLGPHTIELHPGPSTTERPLGLTTGFTFADALTSPAQAFELRLQRATGPSQWPWGWLLAWALLCAAGTAVWAVLRRARDAQRRQAELARMAQVARLTSLGELAGGMAHELNQPLAAVLASTQAAQRLMPAAPAGATVDGGGDPDGDGADLAAVRQALALAAGQARRASDVLARLRRLVQDPTQATQKQRVDLPGLCQRLLELLEPELRRRGISTTVRGGGPPLWTDPVMLEQIVHNLVTNAMQAMEAAATPQPSIELVVERGPAAHQLQLRVSDNGPGFPPQDLDRVFEPFFTTRTGGLGLGLPLCESLATALGGRLQARNASQSRPGACGAELVLILPVHEAEAPAPADGGSSARPTGPRATR